jgi:hypothetical protein
MKKLLAVLVLHALPAAAGSADCFVPMVECQRREAVARLAEEPGIVAREPDAHAGRKGDHRPSSAASTRA